MNAPEVKFLEPQDSSVDTLAHINRVRDLLDEAIGNLSQRAAVHDASKLVEPEKSAFDRLKALSLSGMAYGSDEYRACLRAEKPAIEHHYKANSHHPEYFPARDAEPMATVLRGTADARAEQANAAMASEPQAAQLLLATAKRVRASADELEAPINGMSLFDVLEMLLDWKAATERMKDGGDIRKSVDINRDRFKISPQLENILRNTIEEMKW